MYQVKCDGYPLLDLRDERLILSNPQFAVEVNTVGSGAFTIYSNHPYIDKLSHKAIFEIADEIGVLFRGRMTEDTKDIINGKAVDLEGAMAFFNDSTIRPFAFPGDFLNDEGYIEASTAEGGNVVEFFLGWLIEQHNSQVEEFQKLKLGNVTVADVNNYITRSNEDYASTWETISDKLFKSALGGYLCARYEEDGTYIDYLAKFELTNPQEIAYGENLTDLSNTTDYAEIYSAVIPIGAEIETTIETEDGTSTIKKRLTLAELEDGNITDDIVKKGDTLYSKSAVALYGWKCAPVKNTTWDDVYELENLKTKGCEFFATGTLPTNTIELSAADLHFTDKEIQSFRPYRNVKMRSSVHGLSDIYMLTKLEIGLLSPQSAKITVGKTQLTMTGKQNSNAQKIEIVQKDIEATRKSITEVNEQLLIQSTQIINDCEQIILAALESYVETGDFEQYKSEVSSSLTQMADNITLSFERTETQINNVDGDLQVVESNLSKHFEFTENGLRIKQGDNAISLLLDNDKIAFYKDYKGDGSDIPFGYWDGATKEFYTGSIIVEVEKRAQFGNFAFIPRGDGSLQLLKVGGA